MNPELNLTYEEKNKIRNWKQSLHKNEREFIYMFIENGKFTDDGYKLYDYVIKTNDNLSLIVSENVQIF